MGFENMESIEVIEFIAEGNLFFSVTYVHM